MVHSSLCVQVLQSYVLAIFSHFGYSFSYVLTNMNIKQNKKDSIKIHNAWSLCLKLSLQTKRNSTLVSFLLR
jgi:hypothetical protein